MPSAGRGTEGVYTQAGFGYRRPWVINEDRATTEDDDPPELVVHDGGQGVFDEQPTVIHAAPVLTGSQEAVTRTVYLHAPRPPETSSHSARLAVMFLTCFAGTTFIVLTSWGLLTVNRPPRPPPAPPEVRVVEIEKPVPVPVPVPVPIAAEPIPAPAPAPRPRPRSRTRVAPPPPESVEMVPPPEVVVAPTPVPVESAPPPAPQPAPIVPATAMLLSGSYTGKAGGEEVVIDLAFRPEGLVEATIRRPGGGPTTTAIGDYELEGRQATIMLMERGTGDALVYTGTVTTEGAEGRMTSGSRNVGRFSVGR